MLLIHHYQHHNTCVPQVTFPANRPHRPVSAPPKRSPPAETGQPVRTPYGVRGRRLARRQIPLRLAVRPPFSAIPRGEYIVLMQFLVSAGGSETVGWRVRGRLVAGFSRDGGKAGVRPASEPPWAFRFSGKACDVPRERAIYIPNWVPSAATCVQAGRQPVYPAKPTCQSAWRSAMQAGRWSILQVVRLDVLHPVFHADRQTCKQANRHRCRNANCRAYPCGLECVRRAQCSVAPANSSTKMETWADVMQPQV